MPLLSLSIVVDLNALRLVIVVEPLYAQLSPKAALLETPEWDLRPRNRGRVLPCRPRFDPLCGVVGPLHAAGPHRRAQPVDCVVRPFESFIHVFDDEDRKGGSEALLSSHRRPVVDIGQKGRLVEVSPLELLSPRALPTSQKLGSPHPRVLDHPFDLLPLLCVVNPRPVRSCVEPR